MINICHFNTGSGWFLDKIVIRYKEGKEVQEVVFPCYRYVIHGAQRVSYTAGSLRKKQTRHVHTA